MRTAVGKLAVPLLCACVAGVPSTSSHGHQSDDEGQRLSEIGPAAEFDLLDQEGNRLRLADLRGRVVALTFTYTSCVDACPALASRLVRVQRLLGEELAERVHFLAITVDPEVDRPEVLARYASALGSRGPGWSFLTGTEDAVRRVASAYGVIFRKQGAGDVDHTFLTSIIDARGILRVQYMGTRFDVEEFAHDLRDLVAEGAS